MKNLLLSLLALLSLTSCLATSADLERIAMKQAEGEQRIAQSVKEMNEGLIGVEEVTEVIKDSWGDTAREIGQVAEDIKERGESIWEEVLIALAAAVPTVGAGGLALNRYRNRTRAEALCEYQVPPFENPQPGPRA